VARADPGLLRIVLENLIGNAWKFTSKRARGRIEVGVVPRDGVQAMFVRDNGAGFDGANATNLFAPFRRLHAQSEFEGSGIGLATVQRIIRRHGGRVWGESTVDSGATFYFTLSPSQAPQARGLPRPG
jgi:signal transduction histidine kinase